MPALSLTPAGMAWGCLDYSLIALFNPGSDTYHFCGFWQVT